MKPHKHAELIKAWADGAEIQIWNGYAWANYTGQITWREDAVYRIKPEPKPDLKIEFYVEKHEWGNFPRITICQANNLPNLKLIWDGETGELKSAEVLK